MLRLALLETLAGLACLVNTQQRIRESAYLWANRLAASARAGADRQANMMELMLRREASSEPSFATGLAERLQDEDAALSPVLQWIENRHMTPLASLVRQEHTREAADSLPIANAFTSLCLLYTSPSPRD